MTVRRVLAVLALVAVLVAPVADGAGVAASPGEHRSAGPPAPPSASFAKHGGVSVNLRPFNTDIDALEPWIDGISHVRVWGGSRGMATYPTLDAVPEVLLEGPPSGYNVVEQSEIDDLVTLQERHGVRVIYLVNVNDTLTSQAAFVQRLVDEGVDLAMLEMGNELYLGKFALGDTTKLGVTRSWTPEQYVALLEDWVPELAGFGLPIYVIGAYPCGPGGRCGRCRDAGR